MKHHATAITLATLLAAGTLNAAITIDGDFSDWTSVTTTATDPTGDGPNADLDLTEFKIEFDSPTTPTTIFLYYAVDGTNAVTTSYNILIDTDINGATGFTFDGVSTGGFDVLIQSGASHDYSGTAGAWGWDNWAWRGPLVAGSEFEIAIPLSYLGVSAGDPLDFALFTENVTRDYMPDNYTSTSIRVNVVPEPGTTSLLAACLGAGLLMRRRNRN